MPLTAEKLKPAPRCCCVLGTVADTTTLGSGHKAVLLRVALHAGVHEELLLAPGHAARAARQLLEAAKACGASGKDVTIAELELAAHETKPVAHGYEKPLPTIDYVGGYASPATPALRVLPSAPRADEPRAYTLSPAQVESAWTQFVSGSGSTSQIARALNCSTVTVQRAFERAHKGEFDSIRHVYQGGRLGPSVKCEIERLLAERLGEAPVLKPNGKIL